MANRITRVDEARLATRRLVMSHGVDMREARLASGLRQVDVARAIGSSASGIGRVERGEAPRLAVSDLAAHAAAVGLRLSMGLHPAGGRLRDARQLEMINRYRKRVAPGGWATGLEAPAGGPGDLRAFDLVLSRGPIRIGHEFISRLRDVQAQLRPIHLKQRDSRISRVVFVLAATNANRRAADEAGAALLEAFPLPTKAVFGALVRGRDPGANGIVWL
jgi:transcriptional regulator with XRE-family HTH domain